jgi:hypothetical protein
MNTKRSEVSMDNDAGLEKIEDSNEAIGKVREEWKEVTNQLLGKTMMVMECGCGAPKPNKAAPVAPTKKAAAPVASKKTKKSLLASHRQVSIKPSEAQAAQDEEKQMKLILQYEKMEAKLYTKKKELTAIITEHGARERKLDVQKESLDIKIKNNAIDAEQGKAINKRQQDMIDDAAKTLSSYVKTKDAEVKRKKEDLKKAKLQIKELDAKMASCKCPMLL